MARVQVGGKLSDRKGVSLPDTVIPFSALTPKDRSDLDAALDTGIDWVGLSFIQRPDDIAEAKKITCRTERVTGSNFRTRKVCSTPNSEKASGDWVRDQQDRGAIGASAIVNAAGGG